MSCIYSIIIPTSVGSSKKSREIMQKDLINCQTDKQTNKKDLHKTAGLAIITRRRSHIKPNKTFPTHISAST